ncbi:2-octaprenyl-6-methoxyphenyl hydroxylase [Oleispira antarctica RB-8]|uniref:2-octaprenyl-6-methoxyphenyl hydroxylase n=1 Tax=Oleispira antarctica RB-8 TaxID=698738 RepID=R4YJN1_OLEAN|nr:2-octaprenyl-6-methoxyphenyl hydroxylase [Oleispira antarctica RB-8]|tara:strand:- start:370 stop:1668 length:1299 start_codon:yes stop_codon:yes gene_type:complete
MTNSAEKSARFDLVIIGAGMAGLSLLHLLRSSIEQGLKVALVERFELPSLTNKDAGQDTERPPSFDGRATALSYGSQQIFSQLGVWSEIEAAACSIENIQVSDQGRFGQTHIKHTDANVESLGYIIRNRALGEGLIANLPQQLTILAPDSVTAIEITANQKASLTLAAGNTLDAELVVMADGGRSDLAKQLGIQQQSHRYNTHALVTSVRIDRSHKHWAYERFTEAGPIALLPLGEDEFAVVWTLADEVIEEYLAADEATLIDRLQSAFGYRAGRIIALGARASYPLALVKAQEQIRPHLVLLGNAAHSLHPVAGQGFNLALRDAAALAEKINLAFDNGTPIGRWSVVQGYYQQQKTDQRNTIMGSDLLPRLFSQKNTALRCSRDMGLIGLALAPTVRKLFARQAMGLGQPAAKVAVHLSDQKHEQALGQLS